MAHADRRTHRLLRYRIEGREYPLQLLRDSLPEYGGYRTQLQRKQATYILFHDRLFGLNGDGVTSNLKFDILIFPGILTLTNEVVDERGTLRNQIEDET